MQKPKTISASAHQPLGCPIRCYLEKHFNTPTKTHVPE